MRGLKKGLRQTVQGKSNTIDYLMPCAIGLCMIPCVSQRLVHPVNEYDETDQKLTLQVGRLKRSFLRFRASQPGDFRQLWAGDAFQQSLRKDRFNLQPRNRVLP